MDIPEEKLFKINANLTAIKALLGVTSNDANTFSVEHKGAYDNFVDALCGLEDYLGRVIHDLEQLTYEGETAVEKEKIYLVIGDGPSQSDLMYEIYGSVGSLPPRICMEDSDFHKELKKREGKGELQKIWAISDD